MSGAVGHHHNPIGAWRGGLYGGMQGKAVISERNEYRCPWCGHTNVRYERCGHIVCSKCGRGFG